MENIANKKMFENLTMHKQILVAPWTLWETILYRSRKKNWEWNEWKPKKIIWLDWEIKNYWNWSLAIEDRKIHKMYSWSFEWEYFKWNTKQEREVEEWIYRTGCKDEFERDVFVRWYLIDWKLFQKSFFVLTTLTDREWLHERTKHWYNYIIKN